MVIHSVAPAHMLAWPQEAPRHTTRRMGNTFVDLYETPEGLRMSGIHSTDLSIYLKPENAPGGKFNERGFS